MKSPLLIFTFLCTLLAASTHAAAPILIFSSGSLSGAQGSNQYFDFIVPRGLKSLTVRGKAFSSSATGQIYGVGLFGRVPTEDDFQGYDPTEFYPREGLWHMLVHGVTRYRGLGFEVFGVPDPRPYARYAGTFSGIVGTGEFVTLTLSATGAFSGKILLPGGFGIFRGAFGANGDGTSEAPNFYSLQLASASSGNDPGTAVIAGTVAGKSVSVWHTAYRAGDHAPEAGKYTVLLSPTQTGRTLPPGTGFGVATIAPAGGVKTVFKLADGTTLTGGSALHGSASGKHQFVLYPPTFYRKTGRLVGLVTAQALAGSDLDGAVGWIKYASTAKYYPDAIDTTLTLAGARYAARPRGFPAVDFPARMDNIGVTIKGGGFSSVTVTSTWSAVNLVTTTPVNPVGLTVVVNATAGSFNGAFLHPVSGKVTKFSGALFQHPNAPKAAGYLLGPIANGHGLGGSVDIAPR